MVYSPIHLINFYGRCIGIPYGIPYIECLGMEKCRFYGFKPQLPIYFRPFITPFITGSGDHRRIDIVKSLTWRIIPVGILSNPH